VPQVEEGALARFDKYLHGEAVALGTVSELGVGVALGLTPRELLDRAASLQQRLGLPVKTTRAELEASWPFVTADKKRRKNRLAFPIVTGLGAAHIEALDIDRIRDAVLRAG
jgi:3-dehydroquinate synthetase